MKIEILDLHGLNIKESLEKTRQNIDWAIGHGVDVLVINHGKGHHSQSGRSVVKTEIRKMLKEDLSLKENGYRVVFGESDLPIALTYNEGNTLIVIRGLETTYMGGRVQQEKNQRIYSEEEKQYRKSQKRWRRER
ncbi:hypothetical protein SDC9_168183 [bioreactor metagenome]|uniref:Smr domain-containing protein n=1 Tax=bioreactor metagenome TaxID=1076179 RepID=A0A645G9Q7_9ZZZZ|nr:Smr/MutS family protein [Syntrophomonadaceae bacterium]